MGWAGLGFGTMNAHPHFSGNPSIGYSDFEIWTKVKMQQSERLTYFYDPEMYMYNFTLSNINCLPSILTPLRTHST